MKFTALLFTLLFTSISGAETLVSSIELKYKKQSSELYGMYAEVKESLDSHRGERSILISAREKLDFILNKDKNFAPAYREYARLYMKAGHISYGNFQAGALGSAETAILEAIKIEPSYADAFVLLGHLYTKNESYEKAEEALEKANKIGTENPWFHLNYGDLLRATDRRDQALPHYMKVIESKTENRNAYGSALSFLARHFRYKNDLLEAEKWHLKRAGYDQSAWAWGEYSEFMTLWVGDFDKGVESGEKALSIMSYGIGRLGLAYAYFGKWYELRNTDPKQSKEYYLKASALAPDLDKVTNKLYMYEPTRDVAIALYRQMQKSRKP